MRDERLDLSPLDPTRDEVGWRRLATSINMRARPELSRRSGRDGVLGAVGHWAWPMLAAASIIAAVSGGALALVHPPEASSHVVQAFDLEDPVRTWLEDGRAPTTDDLLLALEAGS